MVLRYKGEERKEIATAGSQTHEFQSLWTSGTGPHFIHWSCVIIILRIVKLDTAFVLNTFLMFAAPTHLTIIDLSTSHVIKQLHESKLYGTIVYFKNFCYVLI